MLCLTGYPWSANVSHRNRIQRFWTGDRPLVSNPDFGLPGFSDRLWSTRGRNRRQPTPSGVTRISAMTEAGDDAEPVGSPAMHASLRGR